MSEQLKVCLLAVGVDVIMLLIAACLLAYLLTRRAWGQGGGGGAIAVVVLTQIVWLIPGLLIVENHVPGGIAPYALWFGNWISMAFALVLLQRTATRVPAGLADNVRLDGVGVFGTWRLAVFPFVSRDLAIIALFALMATLLPFWGFINLPEASNSIVFQQIATGGARAGKMAAGSLAGAVPLMALFFLSARRDGRRPSR
jgi:ABC-type glycerol-3-phosphate transport system permease component